MFASPWKTCPQSSATAGEPVDHPEPLEQLEGQPQRQAHHSEEVAADPLDQRRALALDRVGAGLVERLPGRDVRGDLGDRKSTRLNSSHVANSYAAFCLKKKTAGCSASLNSATALTSGQA